MSAITDLWADRKLPSTDGLYFADGTAYDLTIDSGKPNGISILEPFDLHYFLSNDPDPTSHAYWMGEMELPDGGFLWYGETSWGSEGYFARVNSHLSLVWAFLFEESNPFDGVTRNGNSASFHSTSDMVITVDIEDPTRPAPGS